MYSTASNKIKGNRDQRSKKATTLIKSQDHAIRINPNWTGLLRARVPSSLRRPKASRSKSSFCKSDNFNMIVHHHFIASEELENVTSHKFIHQMALKIWGALGARWSHWIKFVVSGILTQDTENGQRDHTSQQFGQIISSSSFFAFSKT